MDAVMRPPNVSKSSLYAARANSHRIKSRVCICENARASNSSAVFDRNVRSRSSNVPFGCHVMAGGFGPRTLSCSMAYSSIMAIRTSGFLASMRVLSRQATVVLPAAGLPRMKRTLICFLHRRGRTAWVAGRPCGSWRGWGDDVAQNSRAGKRRRRRKRGDARMDGAGGCGSCRTRLGAFYPLWERGQAKNGRAEACDHAALGTWHGVWLCQRDIPRAAGGGCRRRRYRDSNSASLRRKPSASSGWRSSSSTRWAM